MSNFSDFYLIENSISEMPLSIDFKNDYSSLAQPNGIDYETIKKFFIDNIGNEVMFIYKNNKNDEKEKGKEEYTVIRKIFKSGETNSSMSNSKYYVRSIQKINEILKIETSKGNLFAFEVLGGSIPYYNLASDKKFSRSIDTNLNEIIKQIKEMVNKDAEQKAEELKKQRSIKGKEAYQKGLPKLQATRERKKAEKSEIEKKAEAERLKQEEIKKLGTKSPLNGRFGYFDINEDQYRTLVKHLKKETNIVGDKFGYVWSPETRTKDNRIFGEGRFYKIKGADKSKPENIFYLFMYFNKYLEDQGMIIFDGASAFDDFLECGIVEKAFENKRIGKDGNGVMLNDYKQCYWINENPRNIAPPLNAENADEISKLSEPKVKKESTWFEKALTESQ